MNRLQIVHCYANTMGSRFTSESERYAHEWFKHLKLIDFPRFISLWQEFYPKVTDQQKDMLPLQAIWFGGDFTLCA